MNRTSLAFLAIAMLVSVGCSTKNYTRQQTTPLINKTNELDDLTAKNSNDIKDVDSRAQAGIQKAQASAEAADQKAHNAGQQADQAQNLANSAVSRVTSLTNTVANLDNYRPVAETSVQFAFDKDNLTKKDKTALDELAKEIPNAKGYIITLEGGADAVGSEEYNYGLSQRRADSVVQYLASKYNVPAHKIYVIGLGKDKPVDSNKTAAGRAKNRRVDIKLMTNTSGGQTPNAAPSASTGTPPGQN
ncbi:MAG TPA: OmpA family protein [Terriglobales bacterium]|nr:OmpA family protein [Terriglobales bacterium]